MDWFNLVLIYIFTNSTSKLIQKYALRDEEVDPIAFCAFWLLMVGILTIPVLPFEKITYPHSFWLWLAVILSAVLYTACMPLYYLALKDTEVSQVETIATTRSIWVLILGILFFRETVHISEFLGITLIFIGLIVIYYKNGSFHSFEKSHFYTLLYAILISCAYALDKFLLSYFSVGFYNLVIYIIPAFLTVIFVPKSLQKIKCLIQPKKNNYLILISCLIQMISTLSLYGAYKKGALSLVGPLAQTSTVLTIIIGMILLKETWNLKRKVIGIAFSLFGVICIKFISF